MCWAEEVQIQYVHTNSIGAGLIFQEYDTERNATSNLGLKDKIIQNCFDMATSVLNFLYTVCYCYNIELITTYTVHHNWTLNGLLLLNYHLSQEEKSEAYAMLTIYGTSAFV